MTTPHDSFDPSLEPLGLPHGASGAASVVEHLVDGVHYAGERLKGELGSLAQTLDDACQECADRAIEYTESTRQAVRRKPLRAVAAALVAGLLLGRLLH